MEVGVYGKEEFNLSVGRVRNVDLRPVPEEMMPHGGCRERG